MIVSWVTFAWVESVPWAVRVHLIVPHLNHVSTTSVMILVLKPHVDLTLNVLLWIKELNVHVCLDFCLTLLLKLDALVNLHLVCLIINVPLDSNAMPNSADLFVTVMMLVCLMSFVLTMCAKRFARATMIVEPTKSAKESNVYLDADQTRIVQLHKLVKTINVLILVLLQPVESMPFVCHKIINHTVIAHLA